MLRKQKINILYLETGETEGGSFESLYHILCSINKEKFHPIVVFFNNNRFCRRLEEIEIEYYLIKDIVYTKSVIKILRKVFLKLSVIIGNIFPKISILYEFLIHWNTIKRLDKIISDRKIDIIHLNDQINRDFFALYLVKKNNIKCLSHLRSPNIQGFNIKKAKFANKTVCHYVAYSDWIKDVWIRLGLKDRSIKVIYNGINLKYKFKKENLYNRYNIDKKDDIIGCIGRIIENRGYDFLIKTFKHLLKEKENCKLLIVGDGEIRIKKRLKELCNSLGLNNNVIFSDFIDNGIGIIRNLDIIILPYKNEPLGRVLLEALLVKTPIIVTNNGSISKIIKDEYNGLLVKYGDVETLKNKIIRLLEDYDLRKKVTENGHKTLVSHFDIKSQIKKLERLYLDCLSINIRLED
ncbi:MAG: glycosyltransferase family 4 protein [Candidatus Odinarchaeia archaeon]